MIHTYRDERYVPRSRALRLLGPVVPTLLVILAVAWVIVGNLGRGLTWANGRDAALGVGLIVAVACVVYRHDQHKRCTEIRLSEAERVNSRRSAE
jgi:hypothetical protein